jgi:hypothetical protein
VSTASAVNRYTYANANPINGTDPSGNLQIPLPPLPAIGDIIGDLPGAIAGILGSAAEAATPVIETGVGLSAGAMALIATAGGIVIGVGSAIITAKPAGGTDAQEAASQAAYDAAHPSSAYPAATPNYTPGTAASAYPNTTPYSPAGSPYSPPGPSPATPTLDIDPCIVAGYTCPYNQPNPTISNPSYGNRTGGSTSSAPRPSNRPCVGLCPEVPGPARGTIAHDPRDVGIDGSTNPATAKPPIYTSDVTGDPKALQGDADPAPEAPPLATQGNGAGHRLPPRGPECRATEAGPQFYRGAKPGEAPSFSPRPTEFKVDAATGTVKPTHGVSVFDNPSSVSSKGFVPHEIDMASVPPELRVIQRGNDLAHYEIVPEAGSNLTPGQFCELLGQIVCKP